MTIDHKTAFDMAPIGLVISAKRLIVDCNRQVLAMFGARREQLIGQSFEVLYPSPAEFERTGARIVAALDGQGYYADDRVMRRVGSGEHFWCHVAGRALDPRRPACGRHLELRGPVGPAPDQGRADAARAGDRRPADRGPDQQADRRRLAISPRTVDVYRARLMKKYAAATTTELIHKLLVA